MCRAVSRRAAVQLLLAATTAPGARGHGNLNWPPSRVNGTMAKGGTTYDSGECRWFTEDTVIPGEPTLNAPAARTVNVHVAGGARDWTRRSPWRAPGTAPVRGSGCGVAGGGPVPQGGGEGAMPPPGHEMNDDGAALPPVGAPAEWRRGAAQEVAWAINANHGGGYSYRLCKSGAGVSEECFQRTVLRFAGDVQWLQRRADAATRVAVPLVRVTNGTHPAGSEWARNPIPICDICNPADCATNDTDCERACVGRFLPACPRGMTQIPEPLPGLSGFLGTNSSVPPPKRHLGFDWNIIDRVVVPQHIEPGEYLLSWRWDCEQSIQIWQNCADVRII